MVEKKFSPYVKKKKLLLTGIMVAYCLITFFLFLKAGSEINWRTIFTLVGLTIAVTLAIIFSSKLIK